MIFDLDPSGTASFALVVWTAKKIKELLDHLALPNYLMTTGSRGLHVLVPLKRVHTFDTVRAFARTIADHLVMQYPTKLTGDIRKIKRGNRIFIDAFRNGSTQTAIAPYCVRARPYASVSAPLFWDEIDNPKLRSDLYTIQTLPKRIDKMGDIWANMQQDAVTLSAAIKVLDHLV
jgi:bifunctional non-homologous end joining protein LigD